MTQNISNKIAWKAFECWDGDLENWPRNEIVLAVLFRDGKTRNGVPSTLPYSWKGQVHRQEDIVGYITQ